jgi:uncharacterized protein (UPF0261 family)
VSTVVLVGSLDTKGAEYRFARDRLRALGIGTVVIDTGVLGDPAFEPGIPAAEVAAAAGTSLAELRARADRGTALAAMSSGAATLLGRLRGSGRLDGVLALGGSGGTTVASAAFRTLPFGIPKLIVSTMTAGNLREFVGDSDLIMAAPVVDIAGLNRITRTVIANAAAAMAGMVSAPLPGDPADRPIVVASMIGLTTRAVTTARDRLEQLGYEVIVFHMTGAGGAAMESFIATGEVAGVLDLTTSELADELGGGICSAGPRRLTAAAERGIPQVVAPGGLDMINFGRPGTVPARYADRVLHQHNSEITLVRTTAAESAELGRILAERVTQPAAAGAHGGRAVIVLPSGGLSAIDTAGHAFHDAEADAALRAAVRTSADPSRARIVEVAGDLDRAEIGTLAADLLHELIASAAPKVTTSPRRSTCTQ